MDALIELMAVILQMFVSLLLGLVRFAILPFRFISWLERTKQNGQSTTPPTLALLTWCAAAACITSFLVAHELGITISLLTTLILGSFTLFSIATQPPPPVTVAQLSPARRKGQKGASWLAALCFLTLGLGATYTANFYTFSYKKKLHVVVKPSLSIEPIYFDLDHHRLHWLTVAKSPTLRHYFKTHYQREWLAYIQTTKVKQKWKRLKKTFKKLLLPWKRKKKEKE